MDEKPKKVTVMGVHVDSEYYDIRSTNTILSQQQKRIEQLEQELKEAKEIIAEFEECYPDESPMEKLKELNCVIVSENKELNKLVFDILGGYMALYEIEERHKQIMKGGE